MDEPVKFRDDAMDAARYGSYSQRKSNTIIVSTGSYDDERWWEQCRDIGWVYNPFNEHIR